YRGAGKPEGDGGSTDKPHRQHAEAVEQRKQSKAVQRAQSPLGGGILGKSGPQWAQDPAQDRLGGQRGRYDKPQKEQVRPPVPSSLRAVVEGLAEGGKGIAESRNGAQDAGRLAEENGELIRLFLAGDVEPAHFDWWRRLGGDTLGFQLDDDGSAD